MNKLLSTGMSFIILISFIFIEDALSWDPDPTHKDITEYAAENSVLSKAKDDYLKNIGLTNGLEEMLKWNKKDKDVMYWLQEGSALEDKWGISGMRSLNHFHDPLKDWGSAGLADYFSGESSLLWAQDGSRQSDYLGGDWSWQKVRQYYYLALTSETEAERQEYFARTFRGLGHQIHLIQDKAVPPHVRNDAHACDALFGKNEYGGLYLETWAKKHDDIINGFAEAPDFPTVNLQTDIVYNGTTMTPITQFIDTNEYNGSNPSASLSIGLSEYTNANFFSEDTIFATEIHQQGHKHYYPYPKKSDTNIQKFIDQQLLPETNPESGDTEFHISKVDNDGSVLINYFVQPTYHTNDNNPDDCLYYKTFYLSEKCHEDYAQKLIPRAVGYSAGLLDYFFRGTIEISLPEKGVFALTDSDPASIDPTKQGFDHITLRAQNTSPEGEEIEGGTIELVVKYKIAQENQFQNNPPEPPDEFHYLVVKLPGIYAIPRDAPEEFAFDLTDNQIPLWATDIYLYLVYRGTLGSEEEAIGVGFKDICEPTPIDYFNVMDQVCLNL